MTVWLRLKFDMNATEFVAQDPNALVIAQNYYQGTETWLGWMFRLTNYTIGEDPNNKAPQLNYLWGQNNPSRYNQVTSGDQLVVDVNEWIEISASVDTVNDQVRITSYSATSGFLSAVYNFNDPNIFPDGPPKGIASCNEFMAIGGRGEAAIDMTVESAAIWDFALSLEDIEQLSYYEFMTACGDQGWYKGDVDKDCKVDLQDFAVIANNFLQCSDPMDPNCTIP
jgi:hypothetical protein